MKIKNKLLQELAFLCIFVQAKPTGLGLANLFKHYA